MMILKVKAAGRGYSMKLVVGYRASEAATRGRKGAIETIVRIGHLIGLMDGFEAPLVEAGVVGYERETLNTVFDLGPNLGKMIGYVRIDAREAVNLRSKGRVIVGVGADEAVEAVYYPGVAHDDDADAAYA